MTQFDRSAGTRPDQPTTGRTAEGPDRHRDEAPRHAGENRSAAAGAPLPRELPRRRPPLTRQTSPWVWLALALAGVFAVAGFGFGGVVLLILAPIVAIFALALWLISKALASRPGVEPETTLGKAVEPEPRRVGPK